MSTKLTRRSFLKSTLAAGAAVSLPARIYAASEGANSVIRIGMVGFNGRGQSHISAYLGAKESRITAMCDVDTTVLDKGTEQLKNKSLQVEAYQDIRKMLESKDIDAVSIATPNHWHSLAAIWAIQAGKDVYVEKPVSHNVWEGRQLVKCAEAHGKIVQMGVQSRSAIGIANALEWQKSLPLGKIKFVRGLCYKRRPSIGKVTEETPWPETVDKDLWFGPAEVKPLMRKKLHYDWHWVWNTGNGDLGNQGIHQMDIARRFLGESTISPAVFSVGGRLGYIDDGETPNSQFIFHDYANAPLIFEVRGLPEKSDAKEMDKYRGASIGVIVQYENGYLVVPDYNNALAYDDQGRIVKKFGNPPIPAGVEDLSPKEEKSDEKKEKESSHFTNFLAAVQSRDTAKQNGRIIDGHTSSALCHTGNISYLLGKKATPGAIREKIGANAEAMDSFERLATHLGANDVDINVDPLTFGEFLKMDPQTERFIDNAAADKMLTREYRAPYIVPEKV